MEILFRKRVTQAELPPPVVDAGPDVTLVDYTTSAVLQGQVQESYQRIVGWKSYELKDHLGNIRVVVGDEKLATLNGATLGLRAAIRSYANYYPFGMNAPGGNWSAGSKYRYGFNGKEQDTDFLNNYDYGFRIYNPTIAKFLSVDPLSKEYPWYTPYQFAGNKPINSIDVDGLEEWDVNGNGTSTLHGPYSNEYINKQRHVNNFTSQILSSIKTYSSLPRAVVRKASNSDFLPTERGFKTRGNANIHPAEHALQINLEKSPYISASDIHGGSTNIKGPQYWINLDVAIAEGAEYIDNAHLQTYMNEFEAAHPEYSPRINMWRKNQYKFLNFLGEGEVLFEGNVSYAAVEGLGTRSLRYIGRGFQIYGIAMTTYDMGNAGIKSYRTGSAKPILAESIRQTGGWAAGWVGFKLGFGGGALLTSETGPFAVAGGIVGGVIFGAAGYYGADLAADTIDENDK